MSTYVIGDIHGCYRTFQALLERIDLSSSGDRLWLVGDLVNGGPHSLETLRWAHGFGGSLATVLGNHDLYLLGRAMGACKKKSRDTLDEALLAPDRVELLEWLRHRPMIHREEDHVVVHAGLLPEWGLTEAVQFSRDVESRLQGKNTFELLAALFGKKGARGKEISSALRQSCRALRILTTIRTCKENGKLCRQFTGPPEAAPEGCLPWFSYPDRRASGVRIYFGHWAALGFRPLDRAVGLDSGCVWGGSLTAFRLEDGQVFQQPNVER
jgi:bis(5'-nucleosyl)-tetraphosphatase (symmetrical)